MFGKKKIKELVKEEVSRQMDWMKIYIDTRIDSLRIDLEGIKEMKK